jgi:hypothetical protein
MDLEARRVALERRNKAHHALVRALTDRAIKAGLDCCCSEYADVLIPGNIFEMKSVSNDEVDQVRAAIGQLYHYRFLHRSWSGYEHSRLYAVFDAPIDGDLVNYLDEIAIGVIWTRGENFEASPRVRSELAWLF